MTYLLDLRSLDRLKIHSVQIDGENVVVDVDGGISVK
jgi:hypothetical protein